MTRRLSIALSAGLLAAIPALGGCVAAAALPVLAAGSVIKSRESNQITRSAASAPGQSSAPPRSGALTRGEPLGGLDADATEVAILPLKDLPPPDAPHPLAVSNPYVAMADFAGATALAEGTRQSAVLTNPGSLAPQTQPCGSRPAAILIDLDPAGGTASTDPQSVADPALAAALVTLREFDIGVAWISKAPSEQMPALRQALARTGLDPHARDSLLLPPRQAVTKQELRSAFARDHCVVAIAGDERSDFDELFDYLKNPAMAAPLAALEGNGWFLIPTPLHHSQGY